MKLLSHTEEFRLYLRDRGAWARYSAERWKHRMIGKTDEEKRSAWNVIPEIVKAELRAMNTDDQARVRKVRAA